MKNKLKHIFGTKMYLISILPYLFLIRINSGETWGINKSIGWAFKISDLRKYIVFLLIGFAFGFIVLHFLKAKTNWLLSMLFFILISFSAIKDNNKYIYIQPIDYTLVFSIIVFIIIIFQSIIQKTKQSKTLHLSKKNNNF